MTINCSSCKDQHIDTVEGGAHGADLLANRATEIFNRLASDANVSCLQGIGGSVPLLAQRAVASGSKVEGRPEAAHLPASIT